MLEAALTAISVAFTAERLMWLFLGVCLGLLIGLLPGLGGVVGASILLPFIFGMDPYSGIALLIGMLAVTQTSDTFTSVLLGVPGSTGSQATIVDGYPLARQGQAGRALGAAFLASMLGGLIGAAFLLVIIPVARPVVLYFRTPDLFMLSLLGLSMVAVLTRGAPLKGLIAGVFGLLLSSVGMAGGTAQLRYTFESTYLFDGLPLVPLALGLFAVPELVNLAVEKRNIAQGRQNLTAGMFDGLRDTLRHKWLVLRSGLLGPLIGLLPGIGGGVIDWIVYGATVQSSRDKSRFGEGEIRGVIGPESANNAKEGGTLVPTLLFGIPGSSAGAILLGGLILMGLQPGPSMMRDENLPLLLSVVLTLAIANVVGAVLCLSVTGLMARMSLVPSARLAPVLFVVIAVASYQSSRDWKDVLLMLAVGSVAYFMRMFGWPRVPVLIGFVLGPAAERYLYISIGRYGADWLVDPSVIVIGVLTIGFVAIGWRSGAKLGKAGI